MNKSIEEIQKEVWNKQTDEIKSYWFNVTHKRYMELLDQIKTN